MVVGGATFALLSHHGKKPQQTKVPPRGNKAITLSARGLMGERSHYWNNWQERHGNIIWGHLSLFTHSFSSHDRDRSVRVELKLVLKGSVNADNKCGAISGWMTAPYTASLPPAGSCRSLGSDVQTQSFRRGLRLLLPFVLLLIVAAKQTFQV